MSFICEVLFKLMNMQNLSQLIHTFVEQMLIEIDRAQIEIAPNWVLDHVCYRAETHAQYTAIKAEWSEFATLLVESEVNGRSIATFKLKEPIIVRDHPIDVVELPAPKANSPYPRGFEHVEVVCDLCLDDLARQYARLSPDRSGLDKQFNQELRIQLTSGAVKFHPLSLESIVRIEGQQKAWTALKELNLLTELSLYRPLIAGTLPLGVETANSDLNILLQAKDLVEFCRTARQRYGVLSDFSEVITNVDGLPTALIKFSYRGVPFELFAQNRKPVEQCAYRHFLAEERLLKLGGKSLRDQILEFRKLGLKTEQAFARALNLSGDPFWELLRLQKLSNQEISTLLTK